jgi:Uma2 family endonuclease
MEPRPRTPYTYREYALLPEDTRRWELIDGDFFVSPSPGSRHQTVSRRLQYAFMTQLEATGVAEVFNAPMDVFLADADVVQPDIVVVRDSAIVTERAIEGIPDLVVHLS